MPWKSPKYGLCSAGYAYTKTGQLNFTARLANFSILIFFLKRVFALLITLCSRMAAGKLNAVIISVCPKLLD